VKFSLPDEIASPQDLTSLIIEVRDFAKWFSHQAIKQKGGIAADQQPELTPLASEMLRQWSKSSSLNSDSLEELVKALEVYQKSASIITITLAAPPTNQLKTALTAWCRQNLSDTILLSFRYNSTILGGMVLRCGSRIFDWSFRRKLMNSDTNFAEILSHV